MSRLLSRLEVTPYLLLGVGLSGLGFLAMSHVVDNLWPIDTARLDLFRDIAQGTADSTSLLQAANLEIIAALLASEMIAVTGLVLPLAYYLNKRFGQESGRSLLIVLRQASWVGSWVVFCTWLQINRSLGIGIAILVAIVLMIFELLLQIRSKAADATLAGDVG